MNENANAAHFSCGKPDEPFQFKEEQLQDKASPWAKFDLLETAAYVDSLTEFIERCDTPMTIALQGNWGSGKTSFMNAIKWTLDKKEIPTVYFSTWEYSRFQTSDDIYASFLIRIVSDIKKRDEKLFGKAAQELLETVAEIVVMAGAAGAAFLPRPLGEIVGTGIQKLVSVYLNHEQEKAMKISAMKSKFSNLIQLAANAANAGKDANAAEKRVVIFVDDLDRLNPETAVEFLEVLKLFLDVKYCVFVLAIDYDVVARGTRKKFGSLSTENEWSPEKEREFFDKIIQLPFRMPVEKYNLNGMVNQWFKDKFKDNGEYFSVITKFLTNALGANPRTMKRLYNYYELLSLVYQQRQGEDLDAYTSALLLISLIVQLKNDAAYRKLAGAETAKDLKKLWPQDKPEDKSDDKPEDKSDALLLKMSEALEALAKPAGKELEQIHKDYIEVVREITSITEADSNPEKRGTKYPRIMAIRLSLDKEEAELPLVSVNTAEEALYQTFKWIWKRYLGKCAQAQQKKLVEGFMKSEEGGNLSNQDTFFAFQEEVKKRDTEGQFRKVREFPASGINCLFPGKTVYLAVSNDTNTKRKYVDRLCQYMNNQKALNRLGIDSSGWVKIQSVCWDTDENKRLGCYPYVDEPAPIPDKSAAASAPGSDESADKPATGSDENNTASAPIPDKSAAASATGSGESADNPATGSDEGN